MVKRVMYTDNNAYLTLLQQQLIITYNNEIIIMKLYKRMLLEKFKCVVARSNKVTFIGKCFTRQAGNRRVTAA